MFYYNLYREGYNFRELDFSDIWDAGSSYSLEIKKEMYGIEIKLEDFDLTKDELDEYLQKCKKFNEAFRDFEHKADNFTFYLFFIIPIVSYVVGLFFYYTSIERYKGMIAGGVCTTTALVLYFFCYSQII